jgi:hypothetical protein
VTDLVKEKLLEELTDLNRWFSEVKAALGLSPKADRGRVLASLGRLCEEKEEDKEQQQLVASYCGYKFWGDLVAAAVKAGEELVVAVVLPEACLEVPRKWCYGPGKPDYNTAQKHLPKVQKLTKKALAFIESKRTEYGDEWAEENNQLVIEAFVESSGWEQLSQQLWEFYKEVEPEPDPSEVWLQAAEESRGALDLSAKLPPVAVTELLDYAAEQGVEVSKQGAEVKEESSNPASFWFDYLFTACVTATLRPDGKSVLNVTERLQKAAAAGGLTSLEKAAGSGIQETVWDPTATLADLLTAYKVYGEATAQEKASWNYVNDTVREALGKAPVETN